jgi:hypothetical protein
MHRDLGGNDAVGFTLTLADRRAQHVGALTFMSDAAPEAIDGAEWAHAFDADVVVAHISNASVQELQALAFPSIGEDEEARAFDDARVALRDSAAEHAQIAHAKLLHALDQAVPAQNKHLFLRGLLSVARRFRDQQPRRPGRVLVVGEFKEQLGPFRGKIARHITGHVLHGAGHTALTADIGLRLRIANSGVSVLCSTCALNNDRLQSERYHPAGEFTRSASRETSRGWPGTARATIRGQTSRRALSSGSRATTSSGPPGSSTAESLHAAFTGRRAGAGRSSCLETERFAARTRPSSRPGWRGCR